ncbi:hypothetical protein [Thalassospira lucentensis]|uniref:hypothetical protein n=1 Tax=Thalassospira lucentensis TaxID=168935 RepID=UPI003D2E8D54
MTLYVANDFEIVKEKKSNNFYIFTVSPQDFLGAIGECSALPDLSENTHGEFIKEFTDVSEKISLKNGGSINKNLFPIVSKEVNRSVFFNILKQLYALRDFLIGSRFVAGENGEFFLFVPNIEVSEIVFGILKAWGLAPVWLAKRKIGYCEKKMNSFRAAVKKIIYLLRLCGYSLFRSPAKPFDCLFVGMSNRSTIQRPERPDLIFGNLPALGNQFGKRVCIFVHMLGDTTGLGTLNVCDGLEVVGYRSSTNIVDVFLSFLSSLMTPFVVPNLDTLAGRYTKKLIEFDIWNSRLTVVSDAFFQKRAIVNLLKNSSAQTIVYPWEGNSWEQVCHQFRDAGLRTLGLQHGALLPKYLKMYAGSGGVKKPQPGLILTSGPKAAELLTSRFGHSSEYLCVGCDVRSGLQSDGEGNVSAPQKADRGSQALKVLVLLQGPIEHIDFHNGLARAFSFDSGRSYTLRPHPAEQIEATLMGSDLKLGGVVRVSNEKKLTNDIIEHDVVIYSGSTAVFEALRLGIPVVHYGGEVGSGGDPLFGLDDTVIKRARDWRSLLDMCDQAVHDINNDERLRGFLQSYASSYFVVPKLDELNRIARAVYAQ